MHPLESQKQEFLTSFLDIIPRPQNPYINSTLILFMKSYLQLLHSDETSIISIQTLMTKFLTSHRMKPRRFHMK
jgi:hypothetical protein